MDMLNPETGGCGCSGQNGGARKLSAYNVFMRKELKEIKKMHPGKSQAECMKMAARKWRAAHPKTASKPKSASKSKTASKKTAKKSSRKSSSR